MLCPINHAEYLTGIIEELNRVVGVDREPPSVINITDFLEAVITKTMRYSEPVPLLITHVCSEDSDFDVNVSLYIYASS